MCVNVFACEHSSSLEGLHMQVSLQHQCLPETVCVVPGSGGRRRCVKEHRAALALSSRLMLIVLRTGLFSPSKFTLFAFGLNEVLLAEASLTCERLD